MNLAVFRTIGVVLFMYLTWRKLREDYPEEDLITYGWVAILGMMVFSRLAYGLINWGVWNDDWQNWFLFWEKPGSNLVVGYLAMIAVSWWWAVSRGWKIWSFLEEMTVNFLILFLGWMLDEVLRSWNNWRQWLTVGLLVATWAAVWFLSDRYRSFVWYRSGKKGFLFLVANMVFWWGWFGITGNYLGLIMGLISLWGLVILGDVLVFLKVSLKRRK